MSICAASAPRPASAWSRYARASSCGSVGESALTGLQMGLRRARCLRHELLDRAAGRAEERGDVLSRDPEPAKEVCAPDRVVAEDLGVVRDDRADQRLDV